MVYLLLGNGFEETEAVVPVDLMRRAGIGVITVGINGQTVCGSHNISVVADTTIECVDASDVDMLILPGGLRGVRSISECPQAMRLIRRVYDDGKFLAAICAAPTILAKLHITDGLAAVCYPGCENEMGTADVRAQACVRDGKIITAASAGCAVPFALALIDALKGEQDARQIREQIVIR